MYKFEEIIRKVAGVCLCVGFSTSLLAATFGMMDTKDKNENKGSESSDSPSIIASSTVFSSLEELKLALDNNNPYLAKALPAYQKLKKSGLTLDAAMPDLNNILLSVISNNSFNEYQKMYLFGNLYYLITNNEDFISFYYLAGEVHLIMCSDTHSINHGIMSCNTLNNECETKGFKESSFLYDDILKGEEEYLYLKSCAKAIGNDVFSRYMEELEKLVQYYISFGGANLDDESLLVEFPALGSTLAPNEDIFDKYLSLAVKLHNTLYADYPVDLEYFICSK